MNCAPPSDISSISISRRQQAQHQEPPNKHDSVKSFFATPDLLVNIFCLLIDDNFLPSLGSLSLVSKNFHRASQSDQLWREVCYKRWRGKWGFHPRWQKALADYYNCIEKERQTKRLPQEKTTEVARQFWRSRYFSEEQDATRNRILADELETLVFDFRFWIGQPTVIDGHIVVKSGLLESASTEVRFSRPIKVGENSREEDSLGPMWSVRGLLEGHPCKEPGIEWFLDEPSGVVQWGFLPNLWPQGSVQRLDNWGWQIQNPNVVLRSIDPLPSSTSILEAGESGETRLKSKLDEAERIMFTSDNLWKDLLETLENVPLRNTPSVNGFRVTADIPRAFIGQYE